MSDLAAIRQYAFDRMLLPASESEHAAALPADWTPAERDLAHQVASRRLVFQLLYELDVSAAKEPDPQWLARTLARVGGLGPIQAEAVRARVVAAYANRTAADEEFARLAPDWPPHRQAAVDRAILRLAHFEMTVVGEQPRIVVNEAVELAKHYSTEKSPAFINALLDRVLHRLTPTGEGAA